MRCVRVVRLRCGIQVGPVKGSLRGLKGLLLLVLLLLLNARLDLLLLLLLLLSLEIHHQRVVVASIEDISGSRRLHSRKLPVVATTRARSTGSCR